MDRAGLGVLTPCCDDDDDDDVDDHDDDHDDDDDDNVDEVRMRMMMMMMTERVHFFTFSPTSSYNSLTAIRPHCKRVNCMKYHRVIPRATLNTGIRNPDLLVLGEF